MILINKNFVTFYSRKRNSYFVSLLRVTEWAVSSLHGEKPFVYSKKCRIINSRHLETTFAKKPRLLPWVHKITRSTVKPWHLCIHFPSVSSGISQSTRIPKTPTGLCHYPKLAVTLDFGTTGPLKRGDWNYPRVTAKSKTDPHPLRAGVMILRPPWAGEIIFE